MKNFILLVSVLTGLVSCSSMQSQSRNIAATSSHGCYLYVEGLRNQIKDDVHIFEIESELKKKDIYLLTSREELKDGDFLVEDLITNQYHSYMFRNGGNNYVFHNEMKPGTAPNGTNVTISIHSNGFLTDRDDKKDKVNVSTKSSTLVKVVESGGQKGSRVVKAQSASSFKYDHGKNLEGGLAAHTANHFKEFVKVFPRCSKLPK